MEGKFTAEEPASSLCHTSICAKWLLISVLKIISQHVKHGIICGINLDSMNRRREEE